MTYMRLFAAQYTSSLVQYFMFAESYFEHGLVFINIKFNLKLKWILQAIIHGENYKATVFRNFMNKNIDNCFALR